MGREFITYIMASRRNGTLYVGATGNPVGRIWQHRNGVVEGFTKHYGVRRLVWYEPHDSREYAFWREKQIKEWQRAWKIRLIEVRNPEWRDLYRELAGEGGGPLFLAVPATVPYWKAAAVGGAALVASLLPAPYHILAVTVVLTALVAGALVDRLAADAGLP